MEQTKLIDFFAEMTPVSSSFADFIRKAAVEQKFRKGAQLIKAGDTINQTWLVMKGLAKSFHIDEQGRQVVTRFWKEGEILILKDRELQSGGFYAGEDVVFLEDTLLVSISNQQLAYAFDNFPETHRLAGKFYFAEIRSRDLRQRMLILDAASAYQEFCQYFPASRLALQDIAYYLNIRPYTLSRIRKRSRDQGK